MTENEEEAKALIQLIGGFVSSVLIDTEAKRKAGGTLSEVEKVDEVLTDAFLDAVLVHYRELRAKVIVQEALGDNEKN